jgi:hypothetical protein
MVDPGAVGFATLAERYRRDGRLADAEGVVRAGLAAKPDAWEGRVALALVLYDRGLEVEARESLEGLLEASASLQGVSLAGAQAPSELRVEAIETEPLESAEATPAATELSVGAPFATGTMADLLERQGDVEGAQRIRASLEVAPDAAPGCDDANALVIEELSRWLTSAQQLTVERA